MSLFTHIELQRNKLKKIVKTELNRNLLPVSIEKNNASSL